MKQREEQNLNLLMPHYLQVCFPVAEKKVQLSWLVEKVCLTPLRLELGGHQLVQIPNVDLLKKVLKQHQQNH